MHAILALIHEDEFCYSSMKSTAEFDICIFGMIILKTELNEGLCRGSGRMLSRVYEVIFPAWVTSNLFLRRVRIRFVARYST